MLAPNIDRLLAVIDELTDRVGAQEWRLTRSKNDNAGESLTLEISRTSGARTEWERFGWEHTFRFASWCRDEGPPSLAKMIACEHAEIDEEIAVARMRSRAAAEVQS